MGESAKGVRKVNGNPQTILRSGPGLAGTDLQIGSLTPSNSPASVPIREAHWIREAGGTQCASSVCSYESVLYLHYLR